MQSTSEDKGASTCPKGEVTPESGTQQCVSLSIGDARHVWCSPRNNGNNAWNVNMGNGNVNNNNTYNRYICCGVSELSEDVVDRFLEAEAACYKNKHSSFDAAKVHYHLPEVFDLARQITNGTWKQGTAIVFGITYPTLREVWCSCYTDRIVHHDVAEVISDATERAHQRNGNVSHGNRKGYSSYTAAYQIMCNMRKKPNGFVGTRDLSGYFMSILKQSACDMLLAEIGDNDKNALIQKLILHDPTSNCELHSSQELIDRIPHNKSLFYAQEGCGLPIGNFYSQLVANHFLSDVDGLWLTDKWKGRILYTRFVDDICVIADDVATINAFFKDVERLLTAKGLKLNQRKKYMQPVRHGVSYCGYTIHSHGIYINNRTVHGCEMTVKNGAEGIEGARDVIKSMNSYFGFFSHCKAFNIQRRIAKMVTDKYEDYVRMRLRHGQIIFQLAPQYSYQGISEANITDYINSIKLQKDEIRKTRRGLYGSRRCRERKRSRRQKN